MRRSRYVARKFANDKRDDVYSPATGCHTSNLVPIVFLQMLKQLELSELGKENYDVVLAALDIKDAFLQVPQQHVVSVNLHGTEYVVLRNLPGQRLGAKAWYWYFREYVTSSMNFEWCSVQPCLAKCEGNVFMVHVDDLLFARKPKGLDSEVSSNDATKVQCELQTAWWNRNRDRFLEAKTCDVE